MHPTSSVRTCVYHAPHHLHHPPARAPPPSTSSCLAPLRTAYDHRLSPAPIIRHAHNAPPCSPIPRTSPSVPSYLIMSARDLPSSATPTCRPSIHPTPTSCCNLLSHFHLFRA
ncbi:hypothetical protein L227DRAFT_232170 [Lentinus tigrinus ALCF2SS1-6]|uniref:Uncharacterized protein n=1 Tax=Lentinus tigrinus ALCF2SS1-6 TaxID=1328759 RepID=A0A5C2S2T8_9APHY|nr:hypothetical protein L227DRAFT_232170 [Lentinus tigrinus ALCF2SS1-6]